MNWHSASLSEVADALSTDWQHGLDPAEASARLERNGPKLLTPSRSTPGLVRFLQQFHQPLIYILPAAADFLATRTPNPHVSFGAGIHFCIGAPLARLEMQTALRVLFKRLPSLQLTGTPRYRDTWHFHALESLTVTW